MRDENIEAKFSKEKEKKVQLPVPVSLFKLFRKVIIVCNAFIFYYLLKLTYYYKECWRQRAGFSRYRFYHILWSQNSFKISTV